MLIEAEILLVESEQLKHDSVLVVLVRVSRCLKNGCHELVQTVIGRREGGAKLLLDHSHGIHIPAVLGMIPYGCIWTVHLEHVLRIVDIAVGLYPLDGHFLNRAAVSHGSLLESSQRVIENLLVNIRKTDAHDKGVHELIVVLSIHGVEQCIHRSGDTLLGSLRHALLEIVGGVEPYVVEDGHVVYSHLHYLLV